MGCPRGTSIICAVSFHPIFRSDGTTDIEITFLATRMSAEGSGMAMWLILQAMTALKGMNFSKIYVQSCSGEHHIRTLGFYHRLGVLSCM